MTFVIVANLDDLEVGDTMLVDELREPVCLIRLDDDDVRAIHNTCTHQQQPLHEGTLQDDDTLVCAAHASRYDLTTGEAVGESSGRSASCTTRVHRRGPVSHATRLTITPLVNTR